MHRIIGNIRIEILIVIGSACLVEMSKLAYIDYVVLLKSGQGLVLNMDQGNNEKNSLKAKTCTDRRHKKVCIFAIYI